MSTVRKRSTGNREDHLDTDDNGNLYVTTAGSTSPQTVTFGGSAAATVTQVTSSATSVTLKAANTARKGLVITNDSTSLLLVKFGATASATSYTLPLPAGQTTYIAEANVYPGVVDGIWTTANGFAYVTEF